MKKNIIFTIFTIIIALLGTACSSSSNNAVPTLNFGKNVVAGQVINSQGLPVPNAEVQLYPSKNAHTKALAKETLAGTSLAMRMNMAGQEFRTTTNQNGEYSFTNVPDGEYTLLAMAGNALQFVQTGIIANSTRGDTTAVNPVLVPTGSATGKATLTGEPFAGAVLYLDGTDNIAITDPEGNFAFSGIAAGNYSLKLLETPLPNDINKVIALAQETPLTIEGASTTDLPSINLTTKNIERFKYYAKGALEPNVTTDQLEGIVILAVQTTPPPTPSIRGAYMGDPDAYEMAFAITDHEGKFILPFREIGHYAVAPLHGPEGFAIEPRMRTVEVKATHVQSAPLTMDSFELVRGFRLSGQLMDIAKEEPLSNVAFLLRDSSDKNFAAKTATDGSFTAYLPNGDYKIIIEGYEIVEPLGWMENGVTIDGADVEAEVKLVEAMSDVTLQVTEDGIPSWIEVVFLNEEALTFYTFVPDVNGVSTLRIPYGEYMCYPSLPADPMYDYQFPKELEIATTSVTIDYEVITRRTLPITTKSGDRDIAQTVKGFEVMNGHAYIITQPDAAEAKLRVSKYEDYLQLLKTSYTIDAKGSGVDTEILNVSTAVYNNHLYVLTVDNYAQNKVWVFNDSLGFVNQVDITEDSGVNELATDGNTLMYLLNDQTEHDGQNYYQAAKLKEFGTIYEKGNIELPTTIKHIVPALDDQYIYYPAIETVAGDMGSESFLMIKRRPKIATSTPDIVVVAHSLATGFPGGLSFEANDIFSCELYALKHDIHMVMQISPEHAESGSFYVAYIDKTAQNAIEFDSASYVGSNSFKLASQYPRPDWALGMESIKDTDYILTSRYATGNTGAELEFIKVINPYGVTGNKTFVLGRDEEDRLILNVVYDNYWEPIHEGYIPPAH